MVNRRRARRVLLAKSDRQLADLGLSRELLQQDVNAWPWRAEQAATDEPSVFASVAAPPVRRPAVTDAQVPQTDEQRLAA